MWTDYWKAQYVLWDYEIEPIEEGKKENQEVELTLKQIAEKFDVDVSNLKIKK